MVDNVAVGGTPEEVTEKLNAFLEAGARRFVFMTATSQNNAETIRGNLLEECVPALREHAAAAPTKPVSVVRRLTFKLGPPNNDLFGGPG